MLRDEQDFDKTNVLKLKGWFILFFYLFITKFVHKVREIQNKKKQSMSMSVSVSIINLYSASPQKPLMR